MYMWYELALQSADCRAACSDDCRSNMYISRSHTNGRSIKNTIGVVMNRLVGMGL